MKKFLFLGAFALFALTASAQSTQAPAEKKAKTEQTCSKDANKSTCSKDKAAGCCSKGASASTDAKGATCSKGASASTDSKGATCSKDKAAGCCSAKAAARAQRGRKFSEIRSLPPREVEGVCILVHRCRSARLKLNQKTTHEEVSFPRCICPVRIDSLCTIHASAC